MDLHRLGLAEGTPVILYLQGPTEKVWGILLAMTSAGVIVRGLDLHVFDDWVRQESRGEEELLGLTTVFYPMHRLLRMERDEPLGPLPSYAERYARAVGRTVLQSVTDVAPVKQ